MQKIKGLEYFSIDVNIMSNVKIFQLTKRYGPLGFMSYMIIISHIYTKGYYVEYNLDTLAYLLLKHIPSKYINGNNKLQEVILYMVELDLFDKELFTKSIVTSVGIQEMFVIAAKKRTKQEVYPYWLLSDHIQEDKPEVKQEEVSLSKQHKRMNQKIKEIKEHAPNKHFLTSCLITYRYIDEYSLDIYKFNDLFEELESEYDSNILFDTTKYLCNYASRSSVNIDDKYNYFSKSIKDNLKQLTTSKKNGSVEEMFQKLLEQRNNVPNNGKE